MSGPVKRFKQNLANYKLKKRMPSYRRYAKISNFKEAKKVGIIYSATHPFVFNLVKKFVSFLHERDIKVTILGYVDGKELIDHYLFRKGYNFFTKKDLNWLSIPKNDDVSDFINQPFDILLDLSLKEYFPIHYIVSLSKAKLKVGKQKGNDSPLDMMFDLNKENQNWRELQKEIQKEMKANNTLKDPELERDIAMKSDHEFEIEFLIDQIIHYISKLKSKQLVTA